MGVTVQPFNPSPSWGLFFGSPSLPQNNVNFNVNNLDAAFAGSYAVMTTLVVLTGLFTAIGAGFKKALALKISVALSAITVLAFLYDAIIAVTGACDRSGFSPVGGSCISGLVGQGASGVDVVTWGFQAGFYTFIASTILLICALALQTNNARYS